MDLGGSERKALFADHALVFMIKGIYTKWKHVVCFTFCEGTTSTPDLQRLLKTIIRELRSIGLHIVATISDQGATNQAAINKLIKDREEHCKRNNEPMEVFQGYLIDGEEVVHLYDFPHLLKGLRNNLLTGDLHFVENGKAKVASWSHVEHTYAFDKSREKVYRTLLKITDQHVVPNMIHKMKVKNCTQIFSRTVGVYMRLIAESCACRTQDSLCTVDPKALDTADLILYQLLDSVNGSAKTIEMLNPTSFSPSYIWVISFTYPSIHVFYNSCQVQ